MSEVRMDGNVIKYTDYTKIQQAIQDIYQTKWFQGNAQYPTTFSVLSKDAGTKTSNSYTPQSLLDAGVETDSNTFKSLSNYIAKVFGANKMACGTYSTTTAHFFLHLGQLSQLQSVSFTYFCQCEEVFPTFAHLQHQQKP